MTICCSKFGALNIDFLMVRVTTDAALETRHVLTAAVVSHVCLLLLLYCYSGLIGTTVVDTASKGLMAATAVCSCRQDLIAAAAARQVLTVATAVAAHQVLIAATDVAAAHQDLNVATAAAAHQVLIAVTAVAAARQVLIAATADAVHQDLGSVWLMILLLSPGFDCFYCMRF